MSVIDFVPKTIQGSQSEIKNFSPGLDVIVYKLINGGKMGKAILQFQAADINLTKNTLITNDNFVAHYIGLITGLTLQVPISFELVSVGKCSIWINGELQKIDSNGNFMYTFLSADPLQFELIYFCIDQVELVLNVTKAINFTRNLGETVPLIFNQFGERLKVYGMVSFEDKLESINGISLGNSEITEYESEDGTRIVKILNGPVVAFENKILIGETSSISSSNGLLNLNEKNINIGSSVTLSDSDLQVHNLLVNGKFLQDCIEIGTTDSFFAPRVDYQVNNKLKIICDVNEQGLAIFKKGEENPKFQIDQTGNLHYESFQLGVFNDKFTLTTGVQSIFTLGETGTFTIPISFTDIECLRSKIGGYSIGLDPDGKLKLGGLITIDGGNLDAVQICCSNLLKADTVKTSDIDSTNITCLNFTGKSGTLDYFACNGSIVTNKNVKSQFLEVYGENPQLLFNSNSKAAPILGGSSVGSKIILSPSQFPIYTDVAIGINDSNSMWFSAGGKGTGNYSWYDGVDAILQLDSKGLIHESFHLTELGLLFVKDSAEINFTNFTIGQTGEYFNIKINEIDTILSFDSSGNLVVSSPNVQFFGECSFKKIKSIDTFSIGSLNINESSITVKGDKVFQINADQLKILGTNISIDGIFSVNDQFSLDERDFNCNLSANFGESVIVKKDIFARDIRCNQLITNKIASESGTIGDINFTGNRISSDYLNFCDSIFIDSCGDITITREIFIQDKITCRFPIQYVSERHNLLETSIVNESDYDTWVYLGSSSSNFYIESVSKGRMMTVYYDADTGIKHSQNFTTGNSQCEHSNVFCFTDLGNKSVVHFYFLQKESSSILVKLKSNEVISLKNSCGTGILPEDRDLGPLVYSTNTFTNNDSSFNNLETTSIVNDGNFFTRSFKCDRLSLSNNAIMVDDSDIFNWELENVIVNKNFLPGNTIIPFNLGSKDNHWNNIYVKNIETEMAEFHNVKTIKMYSENANIIDLQVAGTAVLQNVKLENVIGKGGLLNSISVSEKSVLADTEVRNLLVLGDFTTEAINGAVGPLCFNAETIKFITKESGSLIASFSDFEFNLSCPDTPVMNICPNGMLQASFSNKSSIFYNDVLMKNDLKLLGNMAADGLFSKVVKTSIIKTNHLEIDSWILSNQTNPGFLRISNEPSGKFFNFGNEGIFESESILVRNIQATSVSLHELQGVTLKSKTLSLDSLQLNGKGLLSEENVYINSNGSIFSFSTIFECQTANITELMSSHVTCPKIFTKFLTLDNSEYCVSFSTERRSLCFTLANTGGDVAILAAGEKGLVVSSTTGNTAFHGNLLIHSALDVMTTGTLDFTSTSIYTKGGISLEGTLVCGKSMIINRSVELKANPVSNYTLTLPDELPTTISLLTCDSTGKLSFVNTEKNDDTAGQLALVQNTENLLVHERLSNIEQQLSSFFNQEISPMEIVTAPKFFGIVPIGKMIMKKIYVDIKFESSAPRAAALESANYAIVGNVVSYECNLQHQDIFCCTFSNLSVNGARAHILCLTADFCEDLTLSLHYSISPL